jgi:hypothetical protein
VAGRFRGAAFSPLYRRPAIYGPGLTLTFSPARANPAAAEKHLERVHRHQEWSVARPPGVPTLTPGDESPMNLHEVRFSGLARGLRRVQHRARGRGAYRVTDERLTLRQAAARLGVSESAIRKRVERDTLRSDKGPDGRRYVYLDTGADTVADEGADTSATGERNALISELRAHNDTLREQLEAERQGHAEARRLLAAALERIPPQLEAPQEPSEDADTVEEASDSAEPRSATAEAQDELGAERARRETAESTLREGMAEQRRRREEAERERDELRREMFNLRERTEAHETADEQKGRGQPHSATGGAQEGAQRRPWWKRVFRG